MSRLLIMLAEWENRDARPNSKRRAGQVRQHLESRPYPRCIRRFHDYLTTGAPAIHRAAPMNGLPWIRFDTTLPDNPKILELVSRRGGTASAFVYCCGLAYAGRHGTDGFIPFSALSRLHGRKADALALVEVGLWESLDTGWLVHGWDEYQQSSATTEEVRAKQRAGSAKGNCRRWHKVGCDCWKTPTNLRVIP